MNVTLSARVLMSQSAAGSSAAFPTDYRNDNDTITRFVQVISMNASDSIQVQGSVDGTNWASIGVALTAAGQTSFTVPWPYVRVTKTGANGAAVVHGVL